MLTDYLTFDWRSKALQKMEALCALEVELGVYQDKLKAHRVYADRMRAALMEIAGLTGLRHAQAPQLARRALGME